MATTKERTIGGLGLFVDCRRDDIAWIAKHADEVHVPPGRVLALPGDAAREFVVVIDGVCSASDGYGEVILGPGSYWGSAGLLSGRPHGSTVRTRTGARLLVFGVGAFRGLIDRAPSVRDRLLLDLRGRVQQSDQEELSLRAVS